MSVLRDIVEGYSAKLVTAGFTKFLQNQEPHDPDGSFHKKFIVKLMGRRSLGPTQAGGVAVEIFRDVLVEVHWDPENRTSTIWSDIADDELVIDTAMLKDSNKPAGVRILEPMGGEISERGTREIVGSYVYRARFLETANVT